MPAADAVTYYIAPAGNDSANGLTEETAWATFGHSFTVIGPGDTLVLLDGIYRQALDTRLGAPSGMVGNPITIKAKNDGQAVIDGEYERAVVVLQRPYYRFEGIVGRNSGGGSATGRWVWYVEGQVNSSFHRCSGYNADTDGNSAVFGAVGGHSYHINVLFEDCIASGSGRKMFYSHNGNNVIFRRCFAAWQEWNGANFKPGNWPWGDGMEFYYYRNLPDQESIMENCIVYGMLPGYGFSIAPNADQEGYVQNNKILGCMAVKVGMKWDGTPMTWACPPSPNGDICTDFSGWANHRVGFTMSPYTPARMRDNLFQDLFSYGCGGAGLGCSAFSGVSSNNRLVRATLMNNGLGTPVPYEGAGVSVSQFSLNQFSEVTDCKIDGFAQHQGGGAVIVNRYVNGVLTGEPLWPWPMQDRIMAELGIDITTEMTQLLGIDLNLRK